MWMGDLLVVPMSPAQLAATATGAERTSLCAAGKRQLAEVVCCRRDDAEHKFHPVGSSPRSGGKAVNNCHAGSHRPIAVRRTAQNRRYRRRSLPGTWRLRRTMLHRTSERQVDRSGPVLSMAHGRKLVKVAA